MSNPTSSFMEKNIIVVNADDTVKHVQEILISHKLSFIPVIEPNGKCFGVISAIDFLHFYKAHKNPNPNAKYAWEICTHKVIEVSSVISLMEACEIMVKNKIHHLVVTENNAIKGVISSLDLISECLLNKNA
ncbi:MAG: CBS domain-containing protein [Sulfuriflexus sp.]|nr:CBS domain-containing protein [Sulfuriflexus sp.]